jgi:geranylgeranyl diphosphate synthase type I
MDLGARVQTALTAFLDQQRAALGEVAEDLGPMLDELAALVSGGKRLRPAFCYWGWRGLGGDDSDAIVAAAASLELLQACALVHDDVMDRSDIRRGRPSAHRAFEKLHATQGWAGDPAVFGTGVAVLLGDLALSWCDELLTGCGLPDAIVDRGRPAFDRMRSEVIAGQYLDLVGQARGAGSLQAALRVITYKTVRYTVEGPLQFGAAMAGADHAVAQALSGYGVPIGEAFQLRDDLLGVYGDPSVTGKPAGDDLREGKRSVLLAIAAARGADLAGVGDSSLSAANVDRLRSALLSCGAVAEVESMITSRTETALATLDALALTPPATAALHELAVASTTREA